MNSLPFISHHLFVAAIGNEQRRLERPMRRDGASAGPADQANAVPLELVGSREPLSDVPARLPRARITPARA